MTHDGLTGTEHWSLNLINWPEPGAMSLATDADWQLTLTHVVLSPGTRTVPAGMMATVSFLDTFWVAHTVPVTVPVAWDGSTLTLGAVPAAALAALPPLLALQLDWTMNAVGVVTGVPDPAPARTLELRAPWPNPATGPNRIGWSQPRAAAARLDLFDVEGRRLRTLDDRVETAGEHVATWGLADEHGSRVGQGLYFARLTVAGEGTRTQRVIAVR